MVHVCLVICLKQSLVVFAYRLSSLLLYVQNWVLLLAYCKLLQKIKKKEAFPQNLCARCIVYNAKKTAYVVFRRLWENEMHWAHRCIHDAMPNHSRRHRKTEHANVRSLFLFQPFKRNTKIKHLGTVLHVLHPDLQWQLELVTFSFLLLEEWSQLSFSRH